MNPTTNPQQNQIPDPQVDPTKGANQAAASLAFATHLSTQMLQHQAPQAPVDSQNAPGQEQPPKQDNHSEDKKEPNITEELTKFKTEIEGLLDSKLGDIKRELETIMSEEKDENTEEPKTPTIA